MHHPTKRPPERTPSEPFDLDAERALLSCLILEPARNRETIRALAHIDLYSPAHREIFMALRELVNEGAHIDAITVMARIRQTAGANAIGGPAYLAKVLDAAPALRAPEYHAIVVRLAMARRLSHAISTLQLENRQHLEAIKRNETRIGKLRDLIRDTHQNQELVLEQRFLDYLERQIAKYREGDEQ